MSEVRLSTQAGLKMILQCLPESPFKNTASRVIGEAVAKLDAQEKLIVTSNNVAQELAWLSFGSCRGYNDKNYWRLGSIQESLDAYKVARAACAQHRIIPDLPNTQK